jgi:SAM-dependent methyltransferase
MFGYRKRTALYMKTPHSWCSDDWDKRYRERNLAAGQKKVQQNIEFLNFMERALKETGIADRSKDEVSVIELGCGTGPLGAHLLDLGYNNVVFSDYSEVLVDRLSKEFGYNAFVADCTNLSNIEDESYEVILLSGTITSYEDYNMPSKIYTELYRVLKSGGVLVNFVTDVKTPVSFLRSIVYNSRYVLNPVVVMKNNNFVRKIFNKEPVKKYIHFWLYHSTEIKEMVKNSGFSLIDMKYFQIEAGLCKFLPFLKKNSPKGNRQWERFYVDKKNHVREPGIFISNLIRRYNPGISAGSLGFFAVKETTF